MPYWTETTLDLPGRRTTLVVTGDGGCLTGVHFKLADTEPRPTRRAIATTLDPARFVRDDDALEAAVGQLQAYARGDRKDFDLPLRLEGTDFQRSVWAILVDIPYGSTVTYGSIARQLGRPTGSRAVGTAVGSNPVAIVVPCHRVVGANGSLTGFAGGLDNKIALLTREGVSAL